MPAALKCANKPVSLVFSGGGVFASLHESCHAALRSHLEASAPPIGELTHHLLLLVERPRIEFAYDTASGQSQRPRGSAQSPCLPWMSCRRWRRQSLSRSRWMVTRVKRPGVGIASALLLGWRRLLDRPRGNPPRPLAFRVG